MVERREGGESGVKWLQAYRGEAFWEAHHTERWSRELFEAALCRSHTLTPARPGFNNPFPNLDELKEIVKDPIAYQYEHNDGLKSTMILMNGLVQDFNFASYIGSNDEILSTQMYLPMPPARTTLANFFSPLVNNIEQMFLTGEATYPVERTLLTTGLVAAGVDSLFAESTRQETPHLGHRLSANKRLNLLEGHEDMKRIAVITTIYRYLSHAQHFADRFLVGYPKAGRWHRPDMKVVSLYVDQKPEGEQSEDRAREFGFSVYPTIAEALRCGGDEIAVDAVLSIGEHGDYPHNEKNQVLYPRYEFFKECVKVFEEDGRVVPIFNDKHLSYSFEKAKEMVDDGHRLGFGVLSGSSLPVTWRLPDVELPLECEIEDGTHGRCWGFGSDGLSRLRGDAVHDRTSKRAAKPGLLLSN